MSAIAIALFHVRLMPCQPIGVTTMCESIYKVKGYGVRSTQTLSVHLTCKISVANLCGGLTPKFALANIVHAIVWVEE